MWRRRLTTALLIALWLITPCVEKPADEHACCKQMPGMYACCGAETGSNTAVATRTADHLEIQAALLPAIIHANTIHRIQIEATTPPPPLHRDSFDILRI